MAFVSNRRRWIVFWCVFGVLVDFGIRVVFGVLSDTTLEIDRLAAQLSLIGFKFVFCTILIAYTLFSDEILK